MVIAVQNRNLTTLLIALLGAVKLILQAFGVDVITSQQVDSIANGIAALITVAGVIMTHLNHPTKNPLAHPSNGGDSQGIHH